ncbi:MAG: carboxypeptidase regulatory-like domain-containing protein [Acidobacteria bacterium]|nr:carboxypeptidase regulatory-like domain-containing protein [Acidobacteriota bacterium]
MAPLAPRALHAWIAFAIALALGSVASMQGPGGPGRGGPGGMAGGPPGASRGATRDVVASTRLGTATITGMVLTEGTGLPVRRARVTLSGQGPQGGRSTLTDDQGRFVFQALPAGRFTLTASKAGYVDASFGAKRAGRPGTPIQLAEGQKLESVAITLPRGGVLTGMVVDENGEPEPGTQVRAFRYAMRTGERSLQAAGQDQTDDRGIYRIFQLQPGEYVLNAVPRNLTVGNMREAIASEVAALLQQAGQARAGGAPGGGVGALAGGPAAQTLVARANELQLQLTAAEQEQSSAYAPVYYPGTTTLASAATVTLGPGEERSGIDFRLQLVATSRIDGVVLMPDGSPLPAATNIALVSAERAGLPSIPGLSANNARANASGQFSFRNVTPGQYVIQTRANVFREGEPGNAQPPGPVRGGRGMAGGAIAQVLWASSEVFVNGQDVSGLMLTLQPGMTVSGRMEFDGTAAPPADLSRARVNLSTRGAQPFEIGGVPPAQVDASGRFKITGVPPGRYAFSTSVPSSPQPPAGRGGSGPGPFAQNANTTWQLRSAIVNGVDTLDFPLELGSNADVTSAVLTFTDRTQELSGMIQDVSGRPTADYTIIVFPSDRRYWTAQSRRITSTQPGTDGRFAIRGLPPGDYRLTAVTDVEPGEWYDPSFLAQLAPASVGVSLADGEKKTQDIRLAAGR